MPVHSRGRKGSRSKADWLSLSPSSSPTGREHSIIEPLLPDTLAGTVARQPARGGRPSPAQDVPAQCREAGGDGAKGTLCLRALNGCPVPSGPEVPRAWKSPQKSRDGPASPQRTPPGGRSPPGSGLGGHTPPPGSPRVPAVPPRRRRSLRQPP